MALTRCWSLSWSRLWSGVLVLCAVSRFLGRNPQLSGVVSSDQKLLLPCDGVVLDICGLHARIAGELASVSPDAFPPAQTPERMNTRLSNAMPRSSAHECAAVTWVFWMAMKQKEESFRSTTIHFNKNYAAKLHVEGNNHGPNRINASTVFNVTSSQPQTSCVC